MDQSFHSIWKFHIKAPSCNTGDNSLILLAQMIGHILCFLQLIGFSFRFVCTPFALAGTEVKSLRSGKCSIKEAFVRVENGEVYVYGMHITPYEKGNIFNKDPLRVRKLLLHRYEINKIEAKLKEKGLTLVPLKVYFKDSLVKIEIGMARGKKLYDKRQDIAKKDQRREAERDFKVKNLY